MAKMLIHLHEGDLEGMVGHVSSAVDRTPKGGDMVRTSRDRGAVITYSDLFAGISGHSNVGGIERP